MKKSTLHVAIIMDGNGRWATSRGLPRVAGHRAGADAVRRTVEAAVELQIGTLTLYAFSSDNWRRPVVETDALMQLFEAYLRSEAVRCLKNGVRLEVAGRRDRLSPDLLAAIAVAERTTAQCEGMLLRIAVDYSGRDEILRAARAAASLTDFSMESLDNSLGPDVDLLIRTGGERRLSDFLLWQSAYAELVFTPVMWPDFGAPDLEAALADFRLRDRRFGGIQSYSDASPAGRVFQRL
ncbi:MAG: di-trans,poly-cis-decaprenylcistransferase [Bryobacterales bacterium]|nr:di-trans,poly-cis-decaprenylcistransferase [Bryobacterales bacterium]